MAVYGAEFPDNDILQSDIEELAAWAYEHYGAELAGRSILITGATGLIGSQVAAMLAAMDRLYDSHIRLLLPVRDEARATTGRGRLAGLIGRDDILLWQWTSQGSGQGLADMGAVDHIVHCAAPTRSRDFVARPVDTAISITDGMRNVLELARDRGVRSLVELSSLEVYGDVRGAAAPLGEHEFYGLDPALPRSSYSEGKRMAETLCAAYASQYGVPVRILRLTQTFGPGVYYEDERVFMEFTRCALEGRDIVLHTPGRTVRPYLYTADAVRAIVTVMISDVADSGGRMPVYNAAAPATAVSIRELADQVAEAVRAITGRAVELHIEIPKSSDLQAMGYNPELQIGLDVSALTGLGWRPSYDLPQMLGRLARGVVR